MKYKFIHILEYSRFTKGGIYPFEKNYSGENFYVFLNSVNSNINEYLSENQYQIISGKKEIEKIINQNSQSIVVCHSLNVRIAKVINDLNILNLFWLVYGAEVYNNILLYGFKAYGYKSLTIQERLLIILRFSYQYTISLVKNRYTGPFIQKKAIANSKYIGILFQEEYDFFLKKKYVRNDALFVPFTFYSIKAVIDNKKLVKGNGNYILVGNSSNKTNNHLEIIKTLAKKETGNRKYLFPLSYGDDIYAKKVIMAVKKELGEKANILQKFLPINEYEDLLSNCDIAIFNNYRQQAVGNIMSLIYKGCKVYLNSKSTTYQYLKRVGVFFGDIKELKKVDFEFVPLSQMEKTRNRAILQSELDENRFARYIDKYINTSVFES